jgi:hypothetical protein
LANQEGGLGTSLKKSISLKTQAKMTGIKETFDPAKDYRYPFMDKE